MSPRGLRQVSPRVCNDPERRKPTEFNEYGIEEQAHRSFLESAGKGDVARRREALGEVCLAKLCSVAAVRSRCGE